MPAIRDARQSRFLHPVWPVVRACARSQVNDVIGMAYRSHRVKIVFDFDDPMGESTCVACGECVQALSDRRADAGRDAR